MSSAFARIAAILIVFAALPVAGARALEVERVVSPGGITAWLVQDHNNPIITVAAYFRAGSRYDPPSKAGTARMMAALLDEGAGELDSNAFQARIENLSIRMDFGVNRDEIRTSMQTLTVNRDEAFRLYALALASPRFDETAVQRIRSQIETVLRRRDSRPGAVASKAWMAARFPAHPYGRPRWGDMETLGNIKIADLRAYHRANMARDNLVVAVVGDITPEQLAPLLDSTFGGLPEQARHGEKRRVQPKLDGGISVIRRPFPQSVVIFGHSGIDRNHPDFYAALVVNRIFGSGGFNSRLYTEVREKRGLAYSVSTNLNSLEESNLIVGSVATRNDRVAESIRIIREEWRKIAENGVTAEELDQAKRYITGSFPLSIADSDDIARFMATLQLDGQPINYFDIRNGFIERVTLEHANRVARSLYDPAKLTFTVVGDPEGL